MPAACPPRPAPPAFPPPRADELLRRAEGRLRLFDVEGYAPAAAGFREVLALSPGIAPALVGLSEACSFWAFRREILGLECRSHYRVAREAAAEALRLAPGRADGHRALSLALRGGAGRDEEAARREAALAVALDPGDAASWHQAWRAGGYRLDDPRLRRALELRTSCALEIDVGAALFAAGRRGEAAGRFAAALRLNPRNSLAHHNLAVALDAEGRRKEAAAVLRRGLALQPGEPLLRLGEERLAGGASASLEAA